MAFVSLGVSALRGKALTASDNACDVKSFRGPIATPRRPAPQMTFSSIDTPERAATLSESSVEMKDIVIRAAYKHVFGNAYLMEEERAELAKAESEFKLGFSTTREFIRAMGKSEAYRKRFFARSGPYQFVQLNCKHFLGRAPNTQEELSFHVQKLINDGYDAEIDSYVDSDEFESLFGEDSVPRFVFKGGYPKNDNFNRMLVMRQHWDGCSTSTVSGSTAPGAPIPGQMYTSWGDSVRAIGGISRGLPAGRWPEAEEKAPSGPANPNAGTRTRIKIAENLYQVVETPGTPGKDANPGWKKERLGPKRWNGVWY